MIQKIISTLNVEKHMNLHDSSLLHNPSSSDEFRAKLKK